MISIIFSLSSLAEGHSPAYCLAKIQLKLLSTWKDCTAVWFPVQLVNQGLIPLRFRVIFQAVVSFFWDTCCRSCPTRSWSRPQASSRPRVPFRRPHQAVGAAHSITRFESRS